MLLHANVCNNAKANLPTVWQSVVGGNRGCLVDKCLAICEHAPCICGMLCVHGGWMVWTIE